jgi:RimJ/RimL family protein N-acetyltransferase
VTGVSVVWRAVAAGVWLSLVTLPIMLLTGPAAAAAPSTLRVVGTHASAGQSSVIVVVPPELANMALPAKAFRVRRGGRPLPVTVQRSSAAGLDVYVVLDPTTAVPILTAQQSAAADLLQRLPATVRTAVVTSQDAVPVPQRGNAAALGALAGLRPHSAMAVDRTLNRIAAARSDGRRHLVVLVTSCPQDSGADLGPLRADLVGGASQLDIITLVSPCRSRLLPLARRHGGLARLALAPGQVAAAVDAIAYDILGQYRLSVPAPPAATRVEVTTDFAGVHALTEVLLPSAASARAARPPDRAAAPSRDAGGSPRSVLAVLAGFVLVAGATTALGLAARRKGRDWPTSAAEPVTADEPVTLDEILAPAQPPAPATVAEPHGLAFPASGLGDGTIRVRAPRSEDARALHGFAESGDGLAGEWVPLPEHATLADCESMVESWSRAWKGEPGAGDLGLVVENASGGGMIGYLGLQVRPEAVEVRYGTAPSSRGRGYAERALRLVAHWLAEQVPVRRVEAVMLPSDTVSRSVARRVGFVPAGTVRTFDPATGTLALSVRFTFDPADDEGSSRPR